jgi:hypothetical protein
MLTWTRVAVDKQLAAGAHCGDRERSGAPPVPPLAHHGGDIPAGMSHLPILHGIFNRTYAINYIRLVRVGKFNNGICWPKDAN